MARTILLLLLCLPLFPQERFVPIPEGPMPGRPEIFLDAFELADAPVTNAQYADFVRATGHRAPAHWANGQIPSGFENHPVIYVNRYDAEAYVAWRSKKEGRAYRIPMSAEMEYAARPGSATALYPWGDADPAGQANYDATGDRQFPDWQKHLKPVRSYPANRWRLFDLSGNVWQMVTGNPDPAQRRWIYRLEKPYQKESSVAGGSWARSAGYLKVNSRGGAGGAGITHPDLGFRLAREAEGTSNYQQQPRRLVASRRNGDRVFLSWQMLPADENSLGFHVYRSPRRDASGVRLTAEPLAKLTAWEDLAAPRGTQYYRVRAVQADGKPGPPSEWVTAGAEAAPGNVAMRIQPSPKQGNCSPVFGDLDGDGLLDVVFRCDNGIKENTRDPGHWVELEAFTSFGKQLWRRALIDYDHCFGNANNAPMLVADLDGDGAAEVAARMQVGDEVFLAVLNGVNGKLLRKTPWPAMATDISGTSTRVHMAVAHLDGRNLSLITQTGLYENERFHAFDASLKLLWNYDSFGPTSGSGSHHIDIADVDGDGKDEVFDGTTLLNHDGTVRWSIYRLHPDIVAIKHILPGTAKRQVYYAVESSTHAGAYVVDADTGKLHWKLNREDDPRWGHAHIGWAADILASSPGYEMLTNRDGHPAEETVLFSAAGEILASPFSNRHRPMNWSGGAARDLVDTGTGELARFDGKQIVKTGERLNAGVPQCRFILAADLLGDYRDEVVCAAKLDGGGEEFLVLTNTVMPERRELTRTSSREYRLWMARNIGAGYASHFEWEPGH
jgi:rhamnogalacturonan endolyase